MENPLEKLLKLCIKMENNGRKISKTCYDKGLKEGIKQGIEQGIEQGIMQERKEIVQNLLKNGVSLEQITKITGLSKEEIENIIKK